MSWGHEGLATGHVDQCAAAAAVVVAGASAAVEHTQRPRRCSEGKREVGIWRP